MKARHLFVIGLALGAQALVLGSCAWTGPRRETPQPEPAATPIVIDKRGLLSAEEAQAVVTDATMAARDRERAHELVAAIQDVTRTPLVAGNRVKLLIDGPRTYEAVLAAIEQARDHIHIETYIFADDEVGQRFSAALSRKRAAGVKVRIIYDAIGSLESSEGFFDALSRQGIETVAFRPLEPSSFWKVNNRDHRKLIVIDGNVAFA